VIFGHPDRRYSHSAYQVRLYRWLIASSLIFPIIISSGGNLVDLWKEVMEEGGVDVWLRRWQCIFSLDTGLFYISFLIAVWGLRVMMQLHRLGDWLAEIFTTMMTCCSPADVKAGRQESRRSAQNRSGNKLALADEYVWLVFNTSILLFFCFTCPLLTVFFSLYLTTKHTVDMQNWRRFYHAREDQPELLVGAVKLLLLASLWPQINMSAFLMTRSTWEDGTFFTSCALTVANIVLLLIYRLSHYNLLVQLFPYHQPEPAVNEEEKGSYTDPILLLESLTGEEKEVLEKTKTLGGLSLLKKLHAPQFVTGTVAAGMRGIVQ